MKLANVTESVVPSVLLVCFTSTIYSQQIAFPGAEGYGKFATGGRGGKVYEVTTLNSSGPGSLGEAIVASGPRIVVFRVAGTIDGNFNIRNDNITIAGQTAPGDGICIKGSLDMNANSVIIRYIRTRFDPATGESDAIFGRYRKNILYGRMIQPRRKGVWAFCELFAEWVPVIYSQTALERGYGNDKGSKSRIADHALSPIYARSSARYRQVLSYPGSMGILSAIGLQRAQRQGKIVATDEDLEPRRHSDA
jgi:hypothetical protein